MKHATTRILFAYWDGLRGTRAAPERGDVQAGGMRHVLADAFILSNEGPTMFRLAGSRMCALFGRDLAGIDFRRLWRSGDADEAERLIRLVVEDTVGAVIGVHGLNVNGSQLALEMLLLPLRHGGRTDRRLLGSLSPSTVPSWAGLVPLGELHLRSVRIIETGEDGSALDLAAMGSRRNQWIVHEGGAP
jgi:hypothetical protein